MGVSIQGEEVRYKLTVFEIVLFIVGLFLLIVGGFILFTQYQEHGFTMQVIQGIFLWLILVILLIIAAIVENVKEEVILLIREHMVETQLLRKETALMKDALKRKRL